MCENNIIHVLGVEDTNDRSILDRLRYRRVQLTAAELKQHLDQFLSSMQLVIEGLPDQLGDFKLETITLTAEISAKGQVILLGTGGEIASKGGLTFTLKKHS